jgi:hypothetical protein
MNTQESDFKFNFENLSVKWIYFFVGWYWVFAFFSEHAYWSSFGISLFDHVGLTEILVKSAESLLKLLLFVFPTIFMIFIVMLPRKAFQKLFSRWRNAFWFGFTAFLVEFLTFVGLLYLIFSFVSQSPAVPKQSFTELLKQISILMVLVYILMLGMSAILVLVLKEFTSLSSRHRVLLPMIIFPPIFFGVTAQISESSDIKSGLTLKSRHVVSCESKYFTCDQKSIFLIGQLSDRWYFWNLDSESVFSVRGEALDTISLAASVTIFDETDKQPKADQPEKTAGNQ